MALLFVVLSFFLSISLVRCDQTEYHKTIGPLCECSGPAESMGWNVKACYAKCLMEPEPTGRASLSLWQPHPTITGPTIVECSKVKQTQYFTQTWTFSNVKSQPDLEILRVSEQECRDAMADNCPNFACNFREKDELDPEYHYASTTKVEQVTISLMSMPSVFSFRSGSLFISPLSSSRAYNMTDLSGRDGRKFYMWKEATAIPNCPLEAVAVYPCDAYGSYENNDKWYLCAKGRFSVTPINDEADITPICFGVKASKEGFIYSTGEVNMHDELHGRLTITPFANMEADADYLRHKIQQIATHLDAEICHNQCEILAMEARLTDLRQPLVRVGNEYYLMYHNGTGTKCTALYGCSVSKPNTLCGNPPRIGITCTNTSGLWDPLKPFLTSDGVCLKPDHPEKLVFTLGTEHYVVDDNLQIAVGKNFSHGVYPTTFGNLHQSGVQLQIQDLRDMRDQWVSNKAAESGLSRTTTSNRTIDSPSYSIGSSIMSALESGFSMLTSIEHIIGVVVIVLGSLFVLWVAFHVQHIIMRKKTRQTDRPDIVVPLMQTVRQSPARSNDRTVWL